MLFFFLLFLQDLACRNLLVKGDAVKVSEYVPFVLLLCVRFADPILLSVSVCRALGRSTQRNLVEHFLCAGVRRLCFNSERIPTRTTGNGSHIPSSPAPAIIFSICYLQLLHPIAFPSLILLSVYSNTSQLGLRHHCVGDVFSGPCSVHWAEQPGGC
jgi:hypothetical protein